MILLGMIIVVLAGVLRFAFYTRGWQGDEDITLAVVKHMEDARTWNTNWLHANVPEPFRYPQYNFSGYHVFLAAVTRGAHLFPGTQVAAEPAAYRGPFRLLSALCSLVTVILTFRLGGQFGGRAVGLLAAAIVAVAPLLVQDAHYVRPEAFVTLLFVALALCCTSSEPTPWRCVIAGLVVGLLVATKVSFLAVAWLPGLMLLSLPPGRRWLSLLGCMIAGALGGFLLGAPTALAEMPDFAHGIASLRHQYANLHPPHSHIEGGPVGDLMGRYFGTTLGVPLIASACIGVGLLIRARAWRALLLLALPVGLFATYFSTRSVFFERNLSHLVPFVAILSAIGAAGVLRWFPRRRGLRVAASVAVVAALLYSPTLVTAGFVFTELSGRAGSEQAAYEQQLRDQFPGCDWTETAVIVRLPLDQLVTRWPTQDKPMLLKVPDYGDGWTASHLPLIEELFVARKVGERPGPFARVASCTLHTYHRPRNHYWFVTGLRQAEQAP